MKVSLIPRRSVRAIGLASLLVACHGDRRHSPSGTGTDPGAAAPTQVTKAPDTSTQAAPPVPWPTDLDAASTLLRLRAHYHEARAAADAVVEGASSQPVRSEAEWLVRVYEHVAAHFDVALREGFGDRGARTADPLLAEYTPPRSIADSRERERTFSTEATRNHRRLVDFVHTDAFRRIAGGDELLREIQFDVESSQAAQVAAFAAVVRTAHGGGATL